MSKMPPTDAMLRWEEMTQAQKLAIKKMSEASFEAFIRIWFQLIQGQYFLKNWHHTYECELAERVYRGEIKRGIINVAPGSTKTEIWSVHWPVWCIVQCINQNLPSRWLPLSYSDDLVTENAARVKEIIDSEEFQSLWPLRAAKDTKGKSNWKYFDDNGREHRLYGTSIGGQVTGRRGGYMMPGFTGAVVLDDPMPPRDSGSAHIMLKSNLTVARVVRSRLAHDGVPIILVQQRIGNGDTTDYLMSPKSPDTYSQFKLPALIDREYIETLDDKTRQACIADTGFDGERVSYWPDKEPTETLTAMEDADAEMFASQYQQAPDEHMHGGVVYRQQVERIVADGRAVDYLPIEPSLPTYTYWDIGINDDMVVWVMQPHQRELRLVACYGNRDQSMEHYINWLHDLRDEYDIRFKEHVMPHDFTVRDVMTGRTRHETARQMGLKCSIMKRPRLKRDSIYALRQLCPRVVVDTTRCATGWKAMKTLRRDWDPEQEAYKDQLVPKWATNYTDALEQMGLHYRDAGEKSKSKSPGAAPGGWMGG